MDLLALCSPDEHPHGISDDRFAELFTRERDVVLAFHGYAGAIHQFMHGRPSPSRFHVRGYSEEGTTTTPFDMVVLNRMSRYHLCIEALRRAKRRPSNTDQLIAECERMLDRHRTYIVEHLEDMPEIRDWRWS